MIRIILIILILALIFVSVSTIILLNFYKKCPPGCMLVVFNNKADDFGSKLKIIKSGGAFVWPFGGSFAIFDLSPFLIELLNARLTDRDGIDRIMDAKYLMALSSQESIVERAVERFAGLPREQIVQIARDLISSHIRSWFNHHSEKEFSDREYLNSGIKEMLEDSLEKTGLNLMNVDIIDIRKG
jgi:flotillin